MLTTKNGIVITKLKDFSLNVLCTFSTLSVDWEIVVCSFSIYIKNRKKKRAVKLWSKARQHETLLMKMKTP